MGKRKKVVWSWGDRSAAVSNPVAYKEEKRSLGTRRSSSQVASKLLVFLQKRSLCSVPFWVLSIRGVELCISELLIWESLGSTIIKGTENPLNIDVGTPPTQLSSGDAYVRWMKVRVKITITTSHSRYELLDLFMALCSSSEGSWSKTVNRTIFKRNTTNEVKLAWHYWKQQKENGSGLFPDNLPKTVWMCRKSLLSAVTIICHPSIPGSL